MQSTTLDEIGDAVGYSATRVLVAWYSGKRLHVPTVARSDHFIARLIGLPKWQALVQVFGGETVLVPVEATDATYRRDRRIAELFAEGLQSVEVAKRENISRRRAEQLRRELILRGWLVYATDHRLQAGRGRPSNAYAAQTPVILGTGEVSGELPPGAAAA